MRNQDLDRPSFAEWLSADVDALAGNGVKWLDAQRRSAREKVFASGVPNSKQEGWRYTGLKSILEQPFAPCTETLTAVQPGDIEDLLLPGLDAYRVVLVNGRFVSHLSDLAGLPRGARAGSLRVILDSDPDALEGRLNRIAGEGAHIFSTLNTAGLDDGFVLLLSEGQVLERPVEVIHLSVGMEEPRVAQPRHLIALESGARARVIERYVSLGESLYCTNSVAEIDLAAGAALSHNRIQMESPNAFHITGLYLRQGARSTYKGVNLGIGASWSRTDLVVDFADRHASCDLKGLYLAGDRQLTDYHLDVRHRVPECNSRESFKGILYGKGRAVFDGRVLVDFDAQKTDAQLSNKNLLLSRNAEVDTKPQLEIFADDVKCSHGTTVGQIEPEMLFYLRSRGISAPVARRMLCLGFAGEIIDGLDTEAVRDYVTEQVGRRLELAPLA
jgi:Fe-S cluster assembly protein SufD